MMKKRSQSGQAMTEVLITASTVLVPLLLLIPLLGKYIDIKHAAIQSARYEAWEYTVWYGNNQVRTGPWSSGERSSGFTEMDGSSLPQPVKSVTRVQQESRRRFFSATDTPIQFDDGSTGWVEDDANALWQDHRGDRLWEGDIPTGQAPESSEATPDYTGGVLNILLDVIDAVFGAIAYAMNLVGSDVGFTAINTDGLAKSTVIVPVSAPAGLIDFATITDTAGVDDSTPALDLDFEAGAAVLTDGWNAGGLAHTSNQVGGITPTSILKDLIGSIPGIDWAWDIVTVLIPEWRRCNPNIPHPLDPGNNGSLWLGYVNSDAVHPDRLEIGGDHSCPDGICNFSYQSYADCIP